MGSRDHSWRVLGGTHHTRATTTTDCHISQNSNHHHCCERLLAGWICGVLGRRRRGRGMGITDTTTTDDVLRTIQQPVESRDANEAETTQQADDDEPRHNTGTTMGTTTGMMVPQQLPRKVYFFSVPSPHSKRERDGPRWANFLVVT